MNILAADIGGTSTKLCMCDERGRTWDFIEYDTESRLGGRHVIERLLLHLGRYSDYDAIAISTAGQVDKEEGCIVYANENIPGYTGMPIRQMVEDKLGKPVKVENDVNAAALGEAYFGAGRPHRDFICLTYGTGIGGAIVFDRRIYRGADGSAAEFGHMLTHSLAETAVLGKLPYYEAFASTTALVKAAMRIDPTCIDGKMLFQKLKDGNDKLALVIDAWLDEVATGLASLVHIFNPAAIIIGGGVMEQEALIPAIERKTKQLVMPSFHNVAIVKAELGNKAGVLGAATLFFTER